MRAARWWGPKDVRLEDVADPVPERHEALVRVTWVGLCGSDLEEYLEGPVVAVPPRVLGHEIVGQVVRAAEDGSGPPPGTTVVVDVVSGCGACGWCREHQEGLCPDLVVTGQHRDGGLAELVVGRADRLVAVPPSLDPRHAALAEPLAVAVRALRAAGPVEGRVVVVLGGGTIGILVAQVARAAAARDVVVLEPRESRRQVLDGLGLRSAWYEDDAQRAEWVRSVVGGRGADVVLEAAGARGAAAEAIRLVRPGGTVMLLGVTGTVEPVDVLDVVLGEKTVRGTAAHMWDVDVVPAVAMLAAGSVDVEPLITHAVDLEEVSSAFELLADRTAPVLKCLVRVAG